MDKPCDFCNVETAPTENYCYRSKVLNAYMKVCLCEKCAEKESKSIKFKISKGGR